MIYSTGQSNVCTDVEINRFRIDEVRKYATILYFIWRHVTQKRYVVRHGNYDTSDRYFDKEHFVWQTIEHRSKVKFKVTENKKKNTIWAITFEPEVVETSGWFQNVQSPHEVSESAWSTTYRFCVTWRSNKTYDFCIFSNLVNFVPIDLKIGTHIDWTYVTCISMATKYPIIKDRALTIVNLLNCQMYADGSHTYSDNKWMSRC